MESILHEGDRLRPLSYTFKDPRDNSESPPLPVSLLYHQNTKEQHPRTFFSFVLYLFSTAKFHGGLINKMTFVATFSRGDQGNLVSS